MTTSQTSSGGASMVIDVMTSLMRAATLSRSQLLDGLPLAQRSLDRRVEPVQADARAGRRRVSSRGSRSPSRPSMSGPTSSTDSPAIAAATRLATGVRLNPQAHRAAG